MSAALFLAAITTAIRSWRLAHWIPVEAEVIGFELVGPIGLSPSKFARQLKLQRTGQGSMGPEIVYYAELVYVVDGVPHRAELTFDGPPDRKFSLRFNPDNASEYTASRPDYSPSMVLAGLGLVSLVYSLSKG
ncbi:MAG TPA: hypothetical protein VII72_20855 [Myxococcota bacterium]